MFLLSSPEDFGSLGAISGALLFGLVSEKFLELSYYAPTSLGQKQLTDMTIRLTRCRLCMVAKAVSIKYELALKTLTSEAAE